MHFMPGHRGRQRLDQGWERNTVDLTLQGTHSTFDKRFRILGARAQSLNVLVCRTSCILPLIACRLDARFCIEDTNHGVQLKTLKQQKLMINDESHAIPHTNTFSDCAHAQRIRKHQ